MSDFVVWGRRASFAPNKNKHHTATESAAIPATATMGHVEIFEIARRIGELTTTQNTVAARVG